MYILESQVKIQILSRVEHSTLLLLESMPFLFVYFNSHQAERAIREEDR